MKKKHKAELIAALDDLIELIDAENPHHEFHHEGLSLDMAKAAEAVYDASQRAVRAARLYDK
jgi:hypothetical protein